MEGVPVFISTLLALILVICSSVICSSVICSPLSAVDWEPVLESELSLTQPKIDPDADAEAIFWRVWVTDHMLGGQQPQTIKEHYLRIKVFTERGVEEQSTIDLISSTGETRIGDLRARTIKPDGRIIEVDKKSVFERTVVRGGGLRVKMKAFSMPGVEPGDIIEYQWREFRDNHFAQYSRLYIQQEIPCWEVSYYIKPSTFAYEYLGYTMKSQGYNIPQNSSQKLPGGLYGITTRDVPAFKSEPRMPPEDSVRSWVLLFYSKGSKVEPEKYWKQLGKAMHKETGNQMKVDGGVKKKAIALTAGAATPQEKLQAIFNFCLNEVKNIYHDRFGITAEQRQELKPNKVPSETLKQGMGTSNDINNLFAALLNAAGIEAHKAMCAGRNDAFFSASLLDPYFLNRTHIAVRLNDTWSFYDLSSPYLEPGMLRWPEEGVQSLILDPKNPTFQRTPFSGTDKNQISRKAHLKLLEDGTIEGTIERVYRGHFGVARKNLYDGNDEDKRRDAIEKMVQARLSTAEVDNIEFENTSSVNKPFTLRYRVRVPGYAQPTGKRLFLQPGFFVMNIDPEFQTSERKYDIYFNYPWTETDEVLIELPEGYQQESPTRPNSTNIEGVGAYTSSLKLNKDTRQLVYTRDFRFGDNASIVFPASAYPQLKRVFDFVHEQDNHVVTLTRKVEAD